MYIELIVILLLIFVFITWTVWLGASRKFSLKKYNPNNDKGRIGEEHRKELIKGGATDPVKSITDGEQGSIGFAQFEEPGILQTTEPSSTGENSKGLRGIFGKFRSSRRKS